MWRQGCGRCASGLCKGGAVQQHAKASPRHATAGQAGAHTHSLQTCCGVCGSGGRAPAAKWVPMPSCMPASSRACLDMSYTTISVAEMIEFRSRLGKYLCAGPGVRSKS